MASNADVRIRVSTDGVDQASREMGEFAGQIEETGDQSQMGGPKLKRLAKAIKEPEVAATLAAAAFVTMTKSLVEFVVQTTDMVDQTNKVAQQLGTTTENLTQLEFAAKRSGVGVEGMRNSLGFLSRNLVEAQRGTGPAAEAFKRLGISTRNADGSLKSMEEILPDIADAFKRNKGQVTQTADAMGIFGRSGKELIPLLETGAEGIEEFRKRSDELGNTLGGDVADRASDFQDRLGDLETASSALKIAIADGLAPATTEWITIVANGLGDLATFVQSVENLHKWVDGIVDAGIPAIFNVANVPLVGALAGMASSAKEAKIAVDEQRASLNEFLDEFPDGIMTIEQMEEANKKLAGSVRDIDAANKEAEAAEERRESGRIRTIERIAASGVSAATEGNQQFAQQQIGLLQMLKKSLQEQINEVKKSLGELPGALVEARDKAGHGIAQIEGQLMQAKLDRRDQAAADLEDALENENKKYEEWLQARRDMMESDRDIAMNGLEESTSTTADAISTTASDAAGLIGSIYDLVGDKANENTKKGLKFGQTILQMIAKLVTARLAQAATGSTAAQIEAQSQSSAMNKITAAATPAAATTSIATFGGSAASGLGLFITAVTAIAGLVGSMLSMGDAGILPDGLGRKIDSAMGRSHSLTIRRNDEAVIDPKGTRELTDMLTMHRRNMQIGAGGQTMPSQMSLQVQIPTIEIGREAIEEEIVPVLVDMNEAGQLELA